MIKDQMAPEEELQEAETGPDTEMEESQEASPEEQRLYEMIYVEAMQSFLDRHGLQAFLEKMDAEGNPAKAIGHTVAMRLVSIYKALKEQQQMDVPKDLLLQVGQELVTELMDIAVAAGKIGESDYETIYKRAVMFGVQEFGRALQGAQMISDEDRTAARKAMAAEGGAGMGGEQPMPAEPMEA